MHKIANSILKKNEILIYFLFLRRNSITLTDILTFNLPSPEVLSSPHRNKK